MDKLTPERRSANMRAIRSKDMAPEMVVRSAVRRLGFGYRLHRKDLPGKPDLVFIGRKKAIFVHGCFWHQHGAEGCADGRRPKSNTDYWHSKLARNVERDQEQIDALKMLGWSVLTVWECEVRDVFALQSRLKNFLI